MDTDTNTDQVFSFRPPERIVVTLRETGRRLYIPFEKVSSWVEHHKLEDGNARIFYTDGVTSFEADVDETAEQINEQYERAMEVKQ